MTAYWKTIDARLAKLLGACPGPVLFCEPGLRAWLYTRPHPLRAIRAHHALCFWLASRPNTATLN